MISFSLSTCKVLIGGQDITVKFSPTCNSEGIFFSGSIEVEVVNMTASVAFKKSSGVGHVTQLIEYSPSL